MKAFTPNFASYSQQPVQNGSIGSSAQPGKTMARVDAGKGRPIHLTPRELEVLALLCEGLPNKLISRRLQISAATVKCHISRILSELGVSSRLQAVVAAARCGLVSESDAVTHRAGSPLQGTPNAGMQGSPMPAFMTGAAA